MIAMIESIKALFLIVSRLKKYGLVLANSKTRPYFLKFKGILGFLGKKKYLEEMDDWADSVPLDIWGV